MATGDWEAGVGARLFLIVFGALAAASLWALADSWGADRLGARAFLALFSFAAVFFGVALALTGPLAAGRSMLGALALALPVTALISWAGLRFADAGQFLDQPAALAVAALMVLLATPFLSVWLTHRALWRDYATLFDTAWTIAVRYLAGWLFVAVFWVVVFLSNALLELVGIDVIAVLFEVDWVRFALSGAMLGLGLAVAFELRAFVSPQLLLQLLRLLLPILLAVVSVFVLALPLRGLSGLFGGFSSAATLMGVTLAAISLISTALDRDDTDGIHTRFMRGCARALALLVPVLSGLAAWAVVLRVQQYGWTPERVLAMAVAVVLVLYGLTYAMAALRGRHWREAIRRGNVTMALVALAACALWLTPVLHPERISAQSQLARYAQGQLSAEAVPLWEMQAEWGRAGQSALQQLAALPGAEELDARLAALEGAETRFEFDRGVESLAARDTIAALVAALPVRPEGAARLTVEMFASVPDYRINRWMEGCAGGTGPGLGCVWIAGGFLPDVAAADQAVILFDAGGRVAANHVILRGGQIEQRVRELYDLNTGTWADLPEDAIARVLAGEFEIAPSGVQALRLQGLQLVPGN